MGTGGKLPISQLPGLLGPADNEPLHGAAMDESLNSLNVHTLQIRTRAPKKQGMAEPQITERLRETTAPGAQWLHHPPGGQTASDA